MCVLKGFNTVLAKSKTNTAFPFGLWFANPTTLYVADEGNGTATYSTHHQHLDGCGSADDRGTAEVG